MNHLFIANNSDEHWALSKANVFLLLGKQVCSLCAVFPLHRGVWYNKKWIGRQEEEARCKCSSLLQATIIIRAFEQRTDLDFASDESSRFASCVVESMLLFVLAGKQYAPAKIEHVHCQQPHNKETREIERIKLQANATQSATRRQNESKTICLVLHFCCVVFAFFRWPWF